VIIAAEATGRPAMNGNAGSHTERRQQAMIEQLTLRIRRKDGRCRA